MLVAVERYGLVLNGTQFIMCYFRSTIRELSL
jgi:hypothetical protein